MNDRLFDKAQRLHQTITQIQRRIFLGNARKNFASPTSAKELSLAQLSTLLIIRNLEPTSLKRLAEASGVSRPSASTMVDRLVELGMVHRQPSALDRREVRISLTEEGQEAVDIHEGELLRSLVDLLERLGPEDAERWCQVYGRIQELLDEEEEHAGAAETILTR